MSERAYDLLVSVMAWLIYCIAIPTMMVLCAVVWLCTPLVLGYQWSMKILKRNW